MSTNTRRQRPVLLVLTGIAVLLSVGTTGCGRHDDPSVASAGPGASKAGASPAADGQDSQLKYSKCMRDQGFAWFPDPGSDGGLKVSVPEGTDQTAFGKAEEACKAYAPGANRNGSISDEDLGKLRQMAQCIRDHGFPKYPDPDANGSITVDSKSLGAEPDDPTFQKAIQECRKYLPPRRSKGSS